MHDHLLLSVVEAGGYHCCYISPHINGLPICGYLHATVQLGTARVVMSLPPLTVLKISTMFNYTNETRNGYSYINIVTKGGLQPHPPPGL